MPYAPLLMAACSPVSTAGSSSAMDSSERWRRSLAIHSSWVSMRTAPTSLMTAAALGKMPTTRLRRLISLLTRSIIRPSPSGQACRSCCSRPSVRGRPDQPGPHHGPEGRGRGRDQPTPQGKPASRRPQDYSPGAFAGLHTAPLVGTREQAHRNSTWRSRDPRSVAHPSLATN